MKVRIIEPVEQEPFEAVARKHGSAFASPQWLGLFDGIERYGIFDDNGRLTGGFVLRKTSSLFPFYRSAPFMPHNALFYEPLSQHPAGRNSVHKKVMEALGEYLLKKRLTLISFSFPKECVDFQPLIWMKFRVVPRYTYVVDLKRPDSGLLSNLAGERRNDLKKAEKDTVAVVFNADPETVSRLIISSFRRNRTQVDARMVSRIVTEMTAVGTGYSFTAYWQERPVAVAYCITDRNTSFYILGGYDEHHRHKGAGALALWKSILHARDLGLDFFDFEGSMIPAVEHYFRGFGGRIVPFFTVNKAPRLAECLLKFRKPTHF